MVACTSPRESWANKDDQRPSFILGKRYSPTFIFIWFWDDIGTLWFSFWLSNVAIKLSITPKEELSKQRWSKAPPSFWLIYFNFHFLSLWNRSTFTFVLFVTNIALILSTSQRERPHLHSGWNNHASTNLRNKFVQIQSNI